jgi:hypothetical protein
MEIRAMELYYALSRGFCVGMDGVGHLQTYLTRRFFTRQ